MNNNGILLRTDVIRRLTADARLLYITEKFILLMAIAVLHNEDSIYVSRSITNWLFNGSLLRLLDMFPREEADLIPLGLASDYEQSFLLML